MARIGIIFGLLLCGLTIAGMVMTTVKSPILFVPMMIGIPTLFCGVVALNPHRRKQAMRTAAILALIGSSIGVVRCAVWASRWIREEQVIRYAFFLNVGLLIVSGTFLAICVSSFIQDRRRRKSQV